MRGLYILDADRNPVPVGAGDGAFIDWAKWRDNISNCRVNVTAIGMDTEVSTIFLGVDMSLFCNGKPVLFETLIIGGPLDGHQWRYSTWAEAEAGHAEVVAICRSGGSDLL